VTVVVAALFTIATASGAAPTVLGGRAAVPTPTARESDAYVAGSAASPSPRRSMPPASSPAGDDLPLPVCHFADERATDTAYDRWQRTIVDTISRLPKGYVPPDLVPVSRAGLAGGGYIRAIAIDDLRALSRAARKAGVRLAVESAYRSEARQRVIFTGWVQTSGAIEARRFSARAGHSEHQLGTAIDFRAAAGGPPWRGHFANTPQATWLAANSWRFGWVLSYPAGAQAETCYNGEPWHYRYVGRDVAAEVHGSGLTLRAWLWRQSTSG
jgi:D-alanyl-D-alanine carboxypeptidase